MTNKITTYDDLLAEKERLKTLLASQKLQVHQDWQDLKTDFQPAFKAASFIGKLVTRDKSNPVLNLGVETIIDVAFKKIILARAGWLGRTIIPFFMKNFSSHVVDDYADKIKSKIFSLFSRKNGKQKTEETPKEGV